MNLGLNLVQPGTVEALVEDMAEESTVNDFRRAVSCQLMFQNLEWQFDQARRGVMPGFSADRVAGTVGSYFTMFRSFGGSGKARRQTTAPSSSSGSRSNARRRREAPASDVRSGRDGL